MNFQLVKATVRVRYVDEAILSRKANAGDAAVAQIDDLGLPVLDVSIRRAASVLQVPRIVHEEQRQRNFGQFYPRGLSAQFVAPIHGFGKD